MAPNPDEHRRVDALDRGLRGPFDEARLLTVGQAADLLGVAHVTLRQWARAGRIVTHPGRLGGLAVDLVRAGDLVAFDPLVRQRGLPAATAVELARSRPNQTNQTERQSAGATQGALVLPADSPAHGPATYGVAAAEWSTELARELERLRGELADERARGRARAVEREAVERDLRRLLARSRGVADGTPGGGPAATAVRAAPLAGTADVARSVRTPQRGLPPLALLPALVLGFVARPWLAPTWSVVESSSGTRLVQASALPPLHAPAPATTAEPVAPAESEVALDNSPRATHTAGEDAGAQVSAGSGDFAGRLSARELRPLDYAAVAGPACAFGGHAADLGPCMGPPTQRGDGIAGTHRVDGVDCCRHHQVAQRLGGDLAQLAATAELARQEGILPPLVAARIERATSLFLRARFGAWRAAGVDDVHGDGHHVHLDAQGIATVETWIELEMHVPAGAAPATTSPGPRVERRDLRLVLEVSDSAGGDVLRELVTLKGPAAVATGGALAGLDADQPTAENDR